MSIKITLEVDLFTELTSDSIVTSIFSTDSFAPTFENTVTLKALAEQLFEFHEIPGKGIMDTRGKEEARKTIQALKSAAKFLQSKL